MNQWGISPSLEARVRKRDRRCVYCGVRLCEKARRGGTRKGVATWEHIVNDASIVTPRNIALCCAPCNSSKGTKVLAVWLQSTYCRERGITRASVAPVIRRALRGVRVAK